MVEELISSLQRLLHADIQQIHLFDASIASESTVQRLQAVAEHSPAFMTLLAEPWLEPEMSESTRIILIHCARIHLYARILDDALDENLSIHRQNLLRAQPMFWAAVQGISASVSKAVADEAVQLISETVAAVQIDDQHPNPLYWGAKNHHLLLIPLLLSGNSQNYQACRTELSTLIALVQAGDEWRQGELNHVQLHADFLIFLTDFLNIEKLAALHQNGWYGAAERIVWNARQLLNELSA